MTKARALADLAGSSFEETAQIAALQVQADSLETSKADAIALSTFQAQAATDLAAVHAELDELRSLIAPPGATAPTITSAPSVVFPGGTGDAGETFTITPGGTGGGSAPFTTQYRIFSESADQGVQPGVTGAIQLAWCQTQTRTFRVVQELVWAGGVVTLNGASPTYTLNVPPAVPVVSQAPQLQGTAAVDSLATFFGGVFNPAVYGGADAHTFGLYRGGTPAQGGVLVSGPTAQAGVTRADAYLYSQADAGATMVLGVIPRNAIGPGIEYYSPPVVVAGGVMPVYAHPNAVQAGWMPGTNEVGQPWEIDLGLPVDPATGLPNAGPNGYGYTLYRDDTAYFSATNQPRFVSGVFSSLDADKNISFTATASNGGGTSVPVDGPSVLVAAASAGLTGQITINGATAVGWGTHDVAALGVIHWAINNNAVFASCERDATPGAVQVTGFTVESVLAPGTAPLYAFAGGAPTASGTIGGNLGLVDAEGGVGGATYGADTTLRTAYLWIGNWNGNMQLLASLADGSATPQPLNFSPPAGTQEFYRVSISYKAAGASSLVVTVQNNQQDAFGSTMYIDAAAIGA